MSSKLEQEIKTVNPNIKNIKALLDAGDTPNSELLTYSYSTGLFAIVDILLDAGATPNSEIIERALSKGDVTYLNKFLHAGGAVPETIGLKEYFLVKGPPNTRTNPSDSSFEVDSSNRPSVFKKYGGQYSLKRRGWLIPNTDSPKEPTPPTPPTPQISTSVPRPALIKPNEINLYSPCGEYGFLTSAFTRKGLFILDKETFDSVEQCLMYKMFQGSYKAKSIKEAETLEEARKLFKVSSVPVAKTPKQLVLNQKLQPLSNSKINRHYQQYAEQIFYRVTRAKFSQNISLKQKLLNTGNAVIINRNALDEFGYVGNLLGNSLMRLRQELMDSSRPESSRGSPINVDDIKTNNLIIEPVKETSMYIIKGNPTPEMAIDIRKLGTYKTSTGRLVRGRLDLDLGGWLIPKDNVKEATNLVFSTFSPERQIEIIGCDFVHDYTKKFIEVAALFSKFRDRSEVGSEDMLFSIKQVFGMSEFNGEKHGQPTESFVSHVKSSAPNITDSGIQLLWDYMAKLCKVMTRVPTNSVEQLRETIQKIDTIILDSNVQPIKDLTEREAIIIRAFNHVYKLLSPLTDSDVKICITTVHMILGKEHYEQVRLLYSKKTKMQGEEKDVDDERQFKKRFHIETLHIKSILANLPENISKKCKLLILTTIDYLMSLDGEPAIDINKRLLLIGKSATIPLRAP